MKKLLSSFIILFLFFSSLQAQVSIVIDGEKDAFYETLTGPDDGYLQLRNFHGNDNGYASSDADLSTKVWFAWDETYLYVYEEVLDDIVLATSSNSYQNDVLELKIDPIPTNTDNSIFSVDITALDTTDADVVASGIQSINDVDNSLKEIVRKKTDDGYIVEFKLAWEAITASDELVSVAVDSVFGLVVQNHDNDATTREASVQWGAVMLDAAWNSPEYLGTVKFLADGKIQLTPTNNFTPENANDLPYDGSLPEGIIVDGKKDAFYHTLTGPDDGYVQMKSYAFNGNGTPHGDEDLSSKTWFYWDEDYLYVYNEVMDDIVLATSTNSYENDVFELKIDPIPTTTANSVFSVDITALDTSDAGVELDGIQSINDVGDSLKMIARGELDGGYTIEFALAWEAITASDELISVAIDSVFGMGINNHDNDETTREASVQWAAVMDDATWNTPALHGTVKFLADNKVQLIPTNNFTPENTNDIPYDGTPFYMHIDGEMDPFHYTLEGPDDGYLQMRYFTSNDNGEADDDTDLSSKIWFAWDDEYLYAYNEVTDDIVLATSTNSYENDALELKIDPVATTTANSVFSVDVTALDTTDADVELDGIQSINAVGDSLKMIVRRSTADGYVIEFKLAWEAITQSGEVVSVAVDSVFGMGVNNHDNDATTREATVQWAAVLADATWNTPAMHGTVKFLADNKFEMIPTNNFTPENTNDLPYDGSDYISVKANDIIPNKFALNQNYPNPFNPSTTITYSLPQSNKVDLILYDVLGRQVAVLVSEQQNAGNYKLDFNAGHLASGVYFYRIRAGQYVQTQKMMLLK